MKTQRPLTWKILYESTKNSSAAIYQALIKAVDWIQVLDFQSLDAFRSVLEFGFQIFVRAKSELPVHPIDEDFTRMLK